MHFDYLIIARGQEVLHTEAILALPKSKLQYHILTYLYPHYIPGNQENTHVQYESLESTVQLFNVGSYSQWLGQRLVLLTLMVCTEKPELATETGNYKLDRVMIAECEYSLQTLVHIFLSEILHMQVNHNLQKIST